MIHIAFPRPARLDGFPRRAFVNKCSSPTAWYADRVGKIIVIERETHDGYWSREGGEYNCGNIVYKQDVTILPLEN